MNKIDYQALREKAEKAKELGNISRYTKAMIALLEFKEAATPDAVLALLDELEASGKRIAELESLTAPQLPHPAVGPQPVSAVNGELAFIDRFESIIGERDEDIDIGQFGVGNYDALMLAALDAFRAAMLQGAEPVQDWIPCSERMPEKYDFDIWVFSPTSGVSDGVQWDGCVFTDDEYQFMVNDATHWMRKAYPAAPQQEEK